MNTMLLSSRHEAMKKWRKEKGIIGWGSHAMVHRAVPVDKDGANSSVIAVKSTSMEYADELQREVQILRQLRGCAHVIHCFGDDVSIDSEGREYYNLLLEYAPAGSLESVVDFRRRRPWDNKITESDVQFYAYQIVKGLLHVHDKGFVHCDLKPDNVLLFPTTTREDNKFILKLADFGVSTHAGDKDKNYYGDNNDEAMTFCRGSLVYASPEYLESGIHHTSDDIWSLGLIVVEMFTGYLPWLSQGSDDNLIHQILEAKHNPAIIIPQGISNTAKDFLSKCFRKEDRWTARMLLQHPFLQNYNDATDEDGVISCPDNPLSCDADHNDQWVFTKDLFPI